MRRLDPFAPIFAALLLCAGAAPLLAQQTAQNPPRPARDSAAARPPANGEVELVFEREVFFYPTGNRRDPFSPLSVSEGPRFEELTLRGIIHSSVPGQSVALLVGPGNRSYRVRRGETVGNARVLDIGPRRVLFAVNNFGVVRQEVLELKRKEPEGA
ncbi:MAG TPA: hypothetical protein VIL18_12615 [Longimicrobiales bacterium]